MKVFHNSVITWLDIGCGTGKIGRIALENIVLEELVFCGSSDKMIRTAKERFQRFHTEFSVCNIQNLEYTNEFDVITAIQVNHYLQVEERKIALQKCYKALKETGYLLVLKAFLHLQL